MRIAVLFYGRILFFKEHYENIMKVFGPNVDFFLSHDPSLDENIDEFKNLYKPIAINNEPITEVNIYKPFYDKYLEMFPHANVYRSSDNMTKHFINKRRVVELLKKHIQTTGTKYDYVCMTRIDIIYQKIIDWSVVTPLENTIYIPEGYDYDGLNDRMCIGNLETIEKYASIYENSLKFIKLAFELNNKIMFPEIILNYHLNDLKIDVKRFPLECNIIKPILLPCSNLIINKNVFNKNTKYQSITNSISIECIDNTIHFKKIIETKSWFSWFGYELEAGLYSLSFNIMSDRDIEFPFIKRHDSDDYFITKKIRANYLESITIDIAIDPTDLKILFIFDDLIGYINIIFYNICFTKMPPAAHIEFAATAYTISTIHIVLFSNGEPFDTVKKTMMDSVSKCSKNKLKIHDYNLETIKSREWFKQIEGLPNVHNLGRRDGYYNAYKIFCVNEVYEQLEENDVLFYLDCSQYCRDGFTESIDRLCSIALEKGIIAGSTASDFKHHEYSLCHNINVWKKILPNCDEHILQKTHILNAWFLLSKNEFNTVFMKEWIHWSLYTDADFKDPLVTQHLTGDQSIFNMLIYKYKLPVYFNKSNSHLKNRDKNLVLKSINDSSNPYDLFISIN